MGELNAGSPMGKVLAAKAQVKAQEQAAKVEPEVLAMAGGAAAPGSRMGWRAPEKDGGGHVMHHCVHREGAGVQSVSLVVAPTTPEGTPPRRRLSPGSRETSYAECPQGAPISPLPISAPSSPMMASHQPVEQRARLEQQKSDESSVKQGLETARCEKECVILDLRQELRVAEQKADEAVAEAAAAVAQKDELIGALRQEVCVAGLKRDLEEEQAMQELQAKERALSTILYLRQELRVAEQKALDATQRADEGAEAVEAELEELKRDLEVVEQVMAELQTKDRVILEAEQLLQESERVLAEVKRDYLDEERSHHEAMQDLQAKERVILDLRQELRVTKQEADEVAAAVAQEGDVIGALRQELRVAEQKAVAAAVAREHDVISAVVEEAEAAEQAKQEIEEKERVILYLRQELGVAEQKALEATQKADEQLLQEAERYQAAEQAKQAKQEIEAKERAILYLRQELGVAEQKALEATQKADEQLLQEAERYLEEVEQDYLDEERSYHEAVQELRQRLASEQDINSTNAKIIVDLTSEKAVETRRRQELADEATQLRDQLRVAQDALAEANKKQLEAGKEVEPGTKLRVNGELVTYKEKKKTNLFQPDIYIVSGDDGNTREVILKRCEWEVVSEHTNWECKVGWGYWMQYAGDINDCLHECHEARRCCEFSIGSEYYKVDFSMSNPMQVNVHSKTQREIRCVPGTRAGGVSLPREWSLPSGTDFQLADVTAERIHEIERWMKGSIQPGHPGGMEDMRVTQVRRVENKLKWEQYQQKRCIIIKTMDETTTEILNHRPACNKILTADRVLDETHNEFWLWHGTSLDIAENTIAQWGFDERRARATGRYGMGNYFADASSKAHQYAASADGHQHCMLLCRVTMGSPFLTRGTHVGDRLPPDNKATPDGRLPYDSIFAESGVANSGDQTHNEYVVFHGDQVYPELLIYYTT